jgi:hypothetical protein
VARAPAAEPGRARGAPPPAWREREAADGAGDPLKGGRLLREGERRAVGELFSFIAAEKTSYAVAETFFATLKKELVNRRSWPTRPELQSAVFEYVEAFYNRRRRQATLGMLSPVDCEQLQPAAGHAERPRAWEQSLA